MLTNKELEIINNVLINFGNGLYLDINNFNNLLYIAKIINYKNTIKIDGYFFK